MKNRTIVIINKGEGEYDDYYEYPIAVYIVPRKDFNVDMEYSKYLYNLIKENFPETGIEWRLWKNEKGQVYNEGSFYPKPIKAKQSKTIHAFLKNHDINTFLLTKCNAKAVEHFKTHLV